jgi:hypothetical protein
MRFAPSSSLAVGLFAWLACAACSSDVGIVGTGGAGQGGAAATGGGGAAVGGGSNATATGVGGSSTSGPGGGGNATTASGTTTGPDPVICQAVNPCTECVATACPEVWCGCTENSECGAIFGCFSQCNGESACIQGCLGAHPEGISDSLLVSDCATQQCSAACPGASTELTPCEQCLYGQCDEAMNACLSEPDCIGLLQCFDGCQPSQLSCQQACYDAYPNGAMPLEDVIGCSDTQCPMACP